jgi:hypothetical protein
MIDCVCGVQFPFDTSLFVSAEEESFSSEMGESKIEEIEEPAPRRKRRKRTT